jgi:hypothetical protein
MPIKFFACTCRGDDDASTSLNQLLNSHKIVSVEKQGCSTLFTESALKEAN